MGILTERADRRAAPRRSRDQIPHITSVKVRSEDVEVINVSRGGILVEGTLRLNPGTENPVEISCVNALVRPRGRVVRCQVMGLSAKGLRYQIAMAFNRPLALLDEEEASNGRPVTVPYAFSTFDINDVELGDPDPALASNSW